MRLRHSSLAFGLVGILAASTTVAAAELTTEKTDAGVRVLVDGKPFAEYLTAAGPKPAVWPIVGPTGKEMTRAYPFRRVEEERKDHPHQRSLWFTHGNVNGVDFWTEAPGCGRIKHRDFEAVSAEDGAAVIETTNDWLAPSGKKICEDQRKLVFRAGDTWRSIDFDIKLTAGDEPVVFGDTKEGTMGVRVPTSLDVAQRPPKTPGHIATSEGLKDREAWGKRAAWVDYFGPVDDETLGIAILNHPKSFRFPTWWHVRDYGLFAANPFGIHDFESKETPEGEHRLEPGQSISFYYRIIFHVGDAEQAKIGEAFEKYSAEAKP